MGKHSKPGTKPACGPDLHYGPTKVLADPNVIGSMSWFCTNCGACTGSYVTPVHDWWQTFPRVTCGDSLLSPRMAKALTFNA